MSPWDSQIMPLMSLTNMPRSQTTRPSRFSVFAGFTTRKALATVSITNTSVSAPTACLSTSPASLYDIPPAQSFIPSPSSPIPYPARRSGEEQPLMHRDTIIKSSNLAGEESNWEHIGQRPKSCLSTSYFHRDSCVGSRTPVCRPQKDSPLHTDKGVLQDEKSARRSNVVTLPVRRTRKTKKFGGETQFLVLVHRSIAWRARSGSEPGADPCAEQDVLLAKRLWKSLVAQGCKPVMFEDKVGPTRNGALEGDTVAPTVTKLEPIVTATVATLEPTTVSADCPSSPVPTPSVAPEILTIPQLVASLTLRHRDRSASRPRSPTSRTGDMHAIHRRPSSLAQVAFSSSDSDPPSARSLSM
ncbi:hypothetical protein WOLCODRAFT_141301 [Wolfiporia cocos MD-104 SS10]|uniref:Uncharacterized protein n=1 Tax=Wolfiporia cocos (strain MD-104) TaxID=742152 RepID=A0A2H3JBI0_WOLCO|nr:hypothetical protein WOLCODRAFT_141301 [Wolfiporia cocos MD-104 SS10]